MIEIMPVHYDIAGDLRHYFNSNMKEILLHIEESMRFCEEKKISVGHGKLYWFLKDDQIFFYCNNMLIYNNQIMNAEMQSHPFTEAFMKGGKTLLNENELEQTMIKDALAGIQDHEHGVFRLSPGFSCESRGLCVTLRTFLPYGGTVCVLAVIPKNLTNLENYV